MKNIYLFLIITLLVSNSALSQTSSRTYLLVHGAGHGAWCWKKVVPLLAAKGYKVITLDLPSVSNDTSQLVSATLDDDAKKVADVANSLQGQVILVGHSSGGIVISQAAELLGAEKVNKLIYLDAFLPKNGESVFMLADKIREANAASFASKAQPEPDLFIISENKKYCKWKPELAEQLFYHDCSAEDIAFAKAHLSWQSVATLATPVHVTDSSYGAIKKYYILCTQAKDLDKSNMVPNVRCEKVYKLPSSHSPFFSMPNKLVDILIDIYN
jgi:pimeloyl-ACP methyl ester carboxylesterase